MEVSKNSKYQTHKKSINFGFFQHLCCCKTSTKLKGDTLTENKIEKKSHNAKKTERGDPSVSSGMVCNAEKEGKIWDHKIL